MEYIINIISNTLSMLIIFACTNDYVMLIVCLDPSDWSDWLRLSDWYLIVWLVWVDNSNDAIHFQDVGSQVGGKQSARQHAATLIGMSPRTIADWVRDFELTTYLADSHRGKHSKTISPINNSDFREEFKTHVKENSRKSGIFGFNRNINPSPL